jgi:hypothetical protein
MQELLNKGKERSLCLPTRPVNRPIVNSAVEYATLSEIITNNLFIYLFPDLKIRKTEETNNKTENLSADPFPSPENVSFSSKE